MLLAQISDVHCGQMFRKETLRAAIKEINNLSPDIVLVTGDLTENGLISEFETASKELKKLRAKKLIYLSETITTAQQDICSLKSFSNFHK